MGTAIEGRLQNRQFSNVHLAIGIHSCTLSKIQIMKFLIKLFAPILLWPHFIQHGCYPLCKGSMIYLQSKNKKEWLIHFSHVKNTWYHDENRAWMKQEASSAVRFLCQIKTLVVNSLKSQDTPMFSKFKFLFCFHLLFGTWRLWLDRYLGVGNYIQFYQCLKYKRALCIAMKSKKIGLEPSTKSMFVALAAFVSTATQTYYQQG